MPHLTIYGQGMNSVKEQSHEQKRMADWLKRGDKPDKATLILIRQEMVRLIRWRSSIAQELETAADEIGQEMHTNKLEEPHGPDEAYAAGYAAGQYAGHKKAHETLLNVLNRATMQSNEEAP